MGMAHIGDLRLGDLGLGRAGVVEELVHLVRTDVAENSAVLNRVPEPVGPAVRPPASPPCLNDLVRRDVDRLNHFADGAGLDQFAGFDGSLHFQPLAVHDGVDSSGFGDGLAHFGQFLERGDAGLVAEKILAVLHGANADGGALVGDLRAEDELDGGIVDDLVLRRDDLDVGEALLERGELVLFAAPGGDQLAAAALDRADHAVDVVVAHAADGELDRVLRLCVGFLPGLGYLMRDRTAAAKCRFGHRS